MFNNSINEANSAKILKKCLKKKVTVATCESFTSGNIARYLGMHPGSSEFYKGGFVVYQTKTKELLLKVDAKKIISKDFCRVLASEAAKKCQADYAIATTGVAGPTTQEDQIPGTIFICIFNNKTEHYYDYHAVLKHGSRNKIIAYATKLALKELALIIN